MNIAFVGEVDHGKSSLIGRLLLDTKSLSHDKLNELNKISKELGTDACLAFLVDQFMEEREGLLTIDTTQIIVKVRNRSFVCIDTPGHFKFLKNMMTGASHADAAVIVVDALQGVQEQTHLHARILEMFGIRPIIFAVNKMDLVDYQEGHFRRIEEAIVALSKSSGISPQAVIPVSAQQGINITRDSGKTKWYKGKTLLSSLDHFKEPLTPAKQPLRLPVQDIYQIDGQSVVVGRLARGTISRRQKVFVSPSGEEAQINDIKIFGQERTSAFAGENVGISCSNTAVIKRGDVLCSLEDKLLPARQFQARILWLSQEPLKENGTVTVQVATQQLQCTVKDIEQTMNGPTFNVTFSPDIPAAVEPFALTNELGRFVIEEKGRRAGAGIISKVLMILILSIPLFWMNAFAENPDDPFLDQLARQNLYSRWSSLIVPRQMHKRRADNSDLENIQSLTYLQGYHPPYRSSNVILYDKSAAYRGYNLFVSAHAPEATLMDMNGNTIHQWRYPSAALPVDHRYCPDYWVHAQILKDGDLLALIPFGGLLKIDKRSRLIWFRRMLCHHDFDIDSDQNIYTLTIKDSGPWDKQGIKTDLISIIAPNGEIKKEISVYDLFKKYPDRAYIDKINALSRVRDFFYSQNNSKIYLDLPGDVFHSNSIQVLDGTWAYREPAFQKGNLLISMRNLGVLICVDPQKEKIVWLMDTVFWNQGQHFAKMLDNGNILLFDNFYHPGASRVVEFDPVERKIVWYYTGQNGYFFSFVIGQCYRLPNGNTLITDSVNGYSIEVTPDKKIVWQFYNPHQLGRKDIQFYNTVEIRRSPGWYLKLIAVIYQMQRIPIDPALGWLKDRT